jgi:hypothetical protein
VAFVDLDLDGFLDLVTANGHIEPEIAGVSQELEFEQSPQVFRNTGRGSFVEVTDRSGEDFSRPGVGRGLAFGDFDADGDPDLLLTVNGGPPRLLRNDTAEESLGNWVRVRLEGSSANRYAVGATVTLFAGDRAIMRSVKAGGSYLSQSETNPVVLGMGALAAADSVVVRWPRGAITTLPGPLGARATLVAREPDSESGGEG